MFPGLQGALRAFTRTSSTEELPDPVDVCGDGHLKEFETALDLVRAEVTKSALGEVPDDVWLRQCLRVSNLDARRAAKVALGMASHRRKYGWPLRQSPRALEAALRSEMHWVLPGRDQLGRRALVFRARALCPPQRPIEELQQMGCLLLEALTEDPDAQRRGIVFIVDCRGAGVGTLRHFSLSDISRGVGMLVDAFPCKLKAIYVLAMPPLLVPLAFVVKSFMSGKLRARIKEGEWELGEAFGGAVALPEELGGEAVLGPRYWDAAVDELLRTGGLPERIAPGSGSAGSSPLRPLEEPPTPE